VEREVDTIIFGTGFRVTDMAAGERIRGRNGGLLAETWAGSPQAHRGTTIAEFPNLFVLVGPNTGLGHTSMVFMIESQVAYVMESLRFMDRAGMATVEVRREAQADFNDRVQREMRGTVWTSGGCASWYLDQAGKNTTLWPGFTWRFRRETQRFDPGEYVVRRPAPQRERETIGV
jgi:cation diffusion facilitator CzcD-associated flavoprotein CzcO